MQKRSTKNTTLSLICAALASVLLLSSCTDPNSVGEPTTVTTDSSSPEPSTTTPITEDGRLIGYKSDRTLPDDMPVLSINTEGGATISSRTEYIGATVSLDEPLEKYEFEDAAAKVRCRGNWTYYGGFEKKAYKLKFDKKVNLLAAGRGADKCWVLLANHVDHTMLRNAAGFAAARVLDAIDYVTPSAYVWLVVNGEDRGVYQLCAQSEISKWRVDLRADDTELDTDYLIELDSRAEKFGGVENEDFFVVEGRQFAIKNDSYADGAATFLKNYFKEAFAAIKSGDRSKIEQYIDIDSFVQMYILQEFVKNPDVGWSSFYIVKKAGGKLYLTCPWDLDLAFGNYMAYSCSNPSGLFAAGEYYESVANSNPFFMKLAKCDFFMDELVPEAFEKYGAAMRDAALCEIDRVLAAYKDEFERNFEIWKVQGESVYPCPDSIAKIADLDGSVDALKDYINERYEWLYKHFTVYSKRK